MGNKITLYDSVISDIKDIIFAGRESVYNAANKAMILTYWNVGKELLKKNNMENIEQSMARNFFRICLIG